MSNVFLFKIPNHRPPTPDEKVEAIVGIKFFSSWLIITVRVLTLLSIVLTTVLLIEGKFYALFSIPSDVTFRREPIGLEWLVLASLAYIKPLSFLPIFWQLYKLATLYQQGIVFSQKNIEKIKKIGIYLILLDIIFIAQSCLVGPIITLLELTDPFFYLQLSSKFFFIGMFIILITRVMLLGKLIQQEQDLTV